MDWALEKKCMKRLIELSSFTLSHTAFAHVEGTSSLETVKLNLFEEMPLNLKKTRYFNGTRKRS
jgi:hypothetical protein